MKIMLAGISLVAILGFAIALAEDHGDHHMKPPATTTAPAAAPINKFCPINTDNAVDPKVTIQHDGKTIGFCCSDCIAEFKKDPAKYMATMK